MGSGIGDRDTQRWVLGSDRDSEIICICVGVETMRVGEASHGEVLYSEEEQGKDEALGTQLLGSRLKKKSPLRRLGKKFRGSMKRAQDRGPG